MSQPTKMFLALAILGGLLGSLLVFAKKEPELPDVADLVESPLSRKASILDAFASEPQPLEGPHAEAINTLFRRLGQAYAAGDRSALARHFDVGMTLAIVKRQGMLPEELEENLNAKVIDMISAEYVKGMAESSELWAWERHEVRSISFIDGDKAAVVYVRHRDKDGIWSKIRWWIVRDGDAWRVYDSEELSVNMRQSTLLGIGFQAMSAGASWIQQLERMNSLIDSMTTGDLEAARRHSDALEGVPFPPSLQVTVWLLRAGLATQEGNYEESEAVLDKVQNLDEDVPTLFWVRAQNRLYQDDGKGALEFISRYEELLGADAESWVVRSDAHHKLGDDTQAESFARKALEDDPQSIDAAISLVMALPAERLDEIAPVFQTLGKPVENFENIAAYLNELGEQEALAALIRAFEAQNPGRTEVTDPYRAAE